MKYYTSYTFVEFILSMSSVCHISCVLQLRDFDKDHISDKTLKTIGKYTANPDFEPVKVGIVSIAAKSLCMWVIAMEKYGKLYRY